MADMRSARRGVADALSKADRLFEEQNTRTTDETQYQPGSAECIHLHRALRAGRIARDSWGERESQVNQVGSPEKPVGNKSPPKQKKGFAASTAAATGMSKTAINIALSRAKAIPEDVRAIIKYTKLDTGTYLDSIKTMEPEEQRERVEHDLVEPSVQQDAKIRAANRATAAVSKPLRDVQLTWRRASVEDRQRIKAWILEQETPASDNDARATEIPEGAL